MKMHIKKIAAVLLCLCLMLSVVFITTASETTATISFANKAQRTTQNASQQIWEQNGIKVTNNKAASTTNVADYANPARFYASSALVIEFPGMTKIVIDCNNSSYATACKNSCKTGTVSASSDKVTIELAEATDAYTIEKLSAQVRVDSITVYAVAAEPEVPEEPKDVAVEGGIYPAMIQGNIYKDGTTGELVVQLDNGERICTANTYNVADYESIVVAAGYRANIVFLTAEGGYSSNHAWKTGTVDIASLAGGAPLFRVVAAADPNQNPFTTDMFPADGLKLVAKVAEEPDTPVEPEKPADLVLIDNPVAGTAYKFGLVQGNLNKTIYINGQMANTYYFGSTEDASAAVDVYLEETTGGYYLYAMVNGAKKYINIVASGTHTNAVYEDTASSVYTLDTAKKMTITAVNGTDFALGTYNNFNTISPSKTSYTTNFWCWFYGTAPTTPEEPEEPAGEITFAQGNVKTAEGKLVLDSSQPHRITTSKLLALADYEKIELGANYRAWLYAYKADETLVNTSGSGKWIEATTYALSELASADAVYFSVTVAKIDNSNLTPADLPADAIVFTKKTATEPDVPTEPDTPVVPDEPEVPADPSVEYQGVTFITRGITGADGKNTGDLRTNRIASADFLAIADYAYISLGESYVLGVAYYKSDAADFSGFIANGKVTVNADGAAVTKYDFANAPAGATYFRIEVKEKGNANTDLNALATYGLDLVKKGEEPETPVVPEEPEKTVDVSPDMEQGTIDGNAGEIKPGVDTRIYNYGLLPLEGLKKVTVGADYKAYYHFYDAEGKWLGSSNEWKYGEITGENLAAMSSTAASVKIVVGPTDANAKLSPDTLAADGLVLTVVEGYTVPRKPVEPEEPKPEDPKPEEPKPEEPKDPAADSTLTIKEAIALGASKEHNTYTEGKYYVEGEIKQVYNTTYGNMYIKDADGNELTIYGTYNADGSARYDAMEVKPVAGDTVKIYGIIGQYNGTAQMKNGWIVEHTPSDKPQEPEAPVEIPEADSVLSIEDALKVGASMDHNVYTEGKYYITGKITEFYGTGGETYGNFYIEDAEGNKILVYGTFAEDGETMYGDMEVKPAVGDTVTVYGVLGQYNGNAQMKNGWFVELPAGDGGEGDEELPEIDEDIDDEEAEEEVEGEVEEEVEEEKDETSPETNDSITAFAITAMILAATLMVAATMFLTNKKVRE